jgi:hypothetical protein
VVVSFIRRKAAISEISIFLSGDFQFLSWEQPQQCGSIPQDKVRTMESHSAGSAGAPQQLGAQHLNI